jgi:hypothetical protein
MSLSISQLLVWVPSQVVEDGLAVTVQAGASPMSPEIPEKTAPD